jgi:hypothetical protein
MRIFPPKPRPAELRCDHAETIERAVQSLSALAAFGHDQVPVSRVLALLGHEPAQPPQAETPPPDPEADPMTGCLPVTAKAPVDKALAPRPPVGF